MKRKPKILLVEDNIADQQLTLEAFKEGGWELEPHIVSDGEEASNFLLRQGKYSAVPKPDLIILDLNLPKKDGREVLREIKGNPKLRRIPVVILTTSESDKDIMQCYDAHANCYVTKPIGVDKFFAMIGDIKKFWFECARLAPANGNGSYKSVNKARH